MGCARGKVIKLTNIYGGVPYHTEEDFSDHWELLGQDFSEGQKSRMITLSGRSKKYLKNLTQKIGSSDSSLFGDFKVKEILVINDQRPFHFSVPNGRIFISLSLLKKYIKYEGLLASVLTVEMIRGHKRIFIKNTMVPSGVVPFKRLRPLLKLHLNLRQEINKWATYVLKKSGFDPFSLLRLLQIKNKNFLDFFDTQDEIKNISTEEMQLKNFLVKNDLFSDINKFLKNSSKGFYHFINEVKQS